MHGDIESKLIIWILLEVIESSFCIRLKFTPSFISHVQANHFQTILQIQVHLKS